jgi:hypothetical protein
MSVGTAIAEHHPDGTEPRWQLVAGRPGSDTEIVSEHRCLGSRETGHSHSHVIGGVVISGPVLVANDEVSR